jgi:cell division protein FtsZ
VQVLPSIENVQASVKSFASETKTDVTAPIEQNESFEMTQNEQDLSSAVSPVATNTALNAREMLLAKAKAFRESQQMQSGTPEPAEKFFQPEQLSMIDDQKQVEEAKKMARDILEVPAFIRKKQGFDLHQG